jgi:hypothetical protein
MSELTYPPDCGRCGTVAIVVSYADGDCCLLCGDCFRDVSVPAGHALAGPFVPVELAEERRLARLRAGGIPVRETGGDRWFGY